MVLWTFQEKLPDGPFSSEEAASGMRAALDNTPFQYNSEAPMPDPNETNSKEAAGLFPGGSILSDLTYNGFCNRLCIKGHILVFRALRRL